MTNSMQAPEVPQIVRAPALAMDCADVLSFLFEVGALQDKNLATVRRVREALEPEYKAASEGKFWDLALATSVLLSTLAQPDHAAFLAYRLAQPKLAGKGNDLAEALAVVNCGYEYCRRPWEVAREPDGFSPGVGRGCISLLALTISGKALPKPGRPPAGDGTTVYICSEPGSSKALAGNLADWCRVCHGGGSP